MLKTLIFPKIKNTMATRLLKQNPHLLKILKTILFKTKWPPKTRMFFQTIDLNLFQNVHQFEMAIPDATGVSTLVTFNICPPHDQSIVELTIKHKGQFDLGGRWNIINFTRYNLNDPCGLEQIRITTKKYLTQYQNKTVKISTILKNFRKSNRSRRPIT